MAKTLLVAAGMTMASGSALAHRIADEEALLGSWQASIEGEDGSGRVRVIFNEDGTYLAMGMVEGADEPVQFWEMGSWELDDETLTFEAEASSEEIDDSERSTEVTIEELDDETARFSSEDDPMWGELEFERVVVSPLSGIWTGESAEGEVQFLFADSGGGEGQLAGGFMGEDSEDTFWGLWAMDDESVVFMVSEGEWSAEAEAEGEFEEHPGEIEDMDDESMSILIDGLGDEAIEFERDAADPVAGEWGGDIEGEDVSFSLDEDGSFTISSSSQQGMEISGRWAHVGGGMIFLVMSFGDMHNATVLHYRMTSPTTMMFGEHMDEMESFERQ